MEPAPLAGESRIVSLGQDAFRRRRSSNPRAPATRAKTEPKPAGSISGTGVMTPMAAANGDVLEKYLIDFLPEHPAYYPEDQLTDKTERFFVNEIIRNNVLKLYDEEVPYSVEIVTLLFKEEPKIIRLSCEIIVERDSQKPIIIGKKGQSIKKLGIESRKELELFFQKQVYMELFVKVREDWRNNKKMLDQFGYESE